MTLSEFKAWFEGYTEGLDGAPTEKQFKRIKAKVAEITGAPTSYPVFVERFRDSWPARYNDIWPQPIVSYSAGTTAFEQGGGKAALMNDPHCIDAAPWDSHVAMYAAGKADALAA